MRRGGGVRGLLGLQGGRNIDVCPVTEISFDLFSLRNDIVNRSRLILVTVYGEGFDNIIFLGVTELINT